MPALAIAGTQGLGLLCMSIWNMMLVIFMFPQHPSTVATEVIKKTFSSLCVANNVFTLVMKVEAIEKASHNKAFACYYSDLDTRDSLL